MSNSVNELSVLTMTIIPLDESGSAFVPTTARYRVDDVLSSTAMVAWTSVTPSKSMTVQIPASANTIIDANQETELKMFTFSTDDGTAAEHNEQIEYQVKNLKFVS